MSTTHLILDVTGYFAAGSGDGYVVYGPHRILDTRPGDGNTGLAGPFVAGVPRQIAVAGVAGLPATGVVAIAGNLTVVNPGAKGYVYLGPDATTGPTSSTINFPAGDTRANNVIVPINQTDGSLSAVYIGPAGDTTSSTDLILDVSGYYTASGGATYHTLEPTRILDTRSNIGLGGAFVALTPRPLGISGGGVVPAGAIAITANMTVTGQSAGGFAAVGPTISADTPFSNLNFPVRDDRANGLTVPLAPDGSVQFVYGGPAGQSVQLILDVCGYYAP
jgi:hypothetical protein